MALVLAFCPSCILASVLADLQCSFLSEMSSSTVLSFARIFCQRQKHDGIVLLLACSTKSGCGHAAIAWNIRSMQWWTRTCVPEAWEGRHHISTSSCCGHRCCLFGLAETHEILGCANKILGRGQQPQNVRGLTKMTGGLPRRDLTCRDYSRTRVGAEVSQSFVAVTAVHRGEVSGWHPKLQFFWHRRVKCRKHELCRPVYFSVPRTTFTRSTWSVVQTEVSPRRNFFLLWAPKVGQAKKAELDEQHEMNFELLEVIM